MSDDSKTTAMTYYKNDKGIIQYHKKCIGCIYDCKQSFRSELACSRYKEGYSASVYKEKRIKAKLSIDELHRLSKVSKRTIETYENNEDKIIKYKYHIKLIPILIEENY